MVIQGGGKEKSKESIGKRRVGFNYMKKDKMSQNVEGVKMKNEKSIKMLPTVFVYYGKIHMVYFIIYYKNTFIHFVVPMHLLTHTFLINKI